MFCFVVADALVAVLSICAAYHHLQHVEECCYVFLQIAVFGRSLGGAVTIHMAASNTDKIAGVIIENTFTSIEEVAPKVKPDMLVVLLAVLLMLCPLLNRHTCVLQCSAWAYVMHAPR